MKINGWHRLWILSGIILALCGAFLYLQLWTERPNGETDWDLIRTFALFWAIGWFGLLALGHGIAWAFRGFSPTKSK